MMILESTWWVRALSNQTGKHDAKRGGRGSGQKSQGAEGHLGDDVGREKLPLYAPVLPRVLNVSLILALATRQSEKVQEDLKEAVAWLSDKDKYEKLLRGRPRASRKRFSNTQMIEEIPRLLQSGILKRAVRTDVKALCNFFALPEPEKKRARLIIKPRELNEQ
jgi:hypothetical protein